MFDFRSLRLRQALLAGAATATALSTFAAPTAYAQEATRAYAIPPQDLAAALRQFALQSGRDVLFPPALVAGKRSPGARGSFTEQGALAALLQGSGLTAERTRSAGYVVRVAAAGGQMVDSATELEEVVVTGTRIRGEGPVGAPVVSLNRDDFDRAGAATLQDVFKTIPQAFGGSPGDSTSYLASVSNIPFDPSAGSYVDLRGLGPGTTLTLINGRRMARGGQQEVMDISLIPLAAIERTEILFDGASALYGSDAIGGVVNVITRSDFDSMELRLRSGLSSRGDAGEQHASLALGRAGERGYVMGGYSFNSIDSFSSADRPFSRDFQPTDLNVDQRVHSAFASGEYRFTPRLSVDGMLNYANRTGRSVSSSTFDSSPIVGESEVEALGISGGVTFELTSTWQLQAAVTYGENRADRLENFIYEGDPTTVEYHYTSDLMTFESVLTGELFQLPAGPIDVAIGASTRRETYDDAGNAYSDSDRSTAAFAEFRVPLMGPAAGGSSPRAVLSLAARYEDYDTWGDTFDPRIGLSFDPVPGLRLRGSYGTSFRAPTAPERTPFNAFHFIFRLADAQSPTGDTRTLILSGNNPDLQPESATTWTAGVDWSPPSMRNLRLSATWFDIAYEDRIDYPALNLISALGDPNAAYAITRRTGPSDAAFDALLLQRFAETPFISGCEAFADDDGYCQRPPADFGAIIDSRLTNLSSLKTSGIDFTAAYSLTRGEDLWDFSLSAALVSEYSIRNNPGAAEQDLLDAPYRPLDWKLSGQAAWTRGPWAASLLVNYADDYRNNTVSPDPSVIIPPTRIEAFTTASLNVQREFGPSGVFGQGARIIFNIDNLFDEQPPTFTNNFLSGSGPNIEQINYDPANSNARGRFFSVTLVANW